jgi:transcriptional regulator with XRE-family HTH domain
LWENEGLISPARSAGRYRVYNHEVLGVLKRIRFLRDVQKLGVPRIKKMLNASQEVDSAASPRQEPAIGPRLRKMRKSLNLGIAEAANRAGISPGFLSAIELSNANASVATLRRLAATYNSTVLEFFDLPTQSRRLLRPGQRRVLRTDSAVDIELLSIGNKMLEPVLPGFLPRPAVTVRTRMWAKSSSTC